MSRRVRSPSLSSARSTLIAKQTTGGRQSDIAESELSKRKGPYVILLYLNCAPSLEDCSKRQRYAKHISGVLLSRLLEAYKNEYLNRLGSQMERSVTPGLSAQQGTGSVAGASAGTSPAPSTHNSPSRDGGAGGLLSLPVGLVPRNRA